MFEISDDDRSWRQSWTELLRGQVRVLGALIRRETREHFGESRLGYLWALIEPLIHLIAFAILFSFVLRRRPLAGGSLTLFLVTGLVPYFLYSKLATYLAGAIVDNRALLNLPLVKPFDVFASRAILQSATYLFVGVLMLVGLFLQGVPQAIPRDPLNLAAAIAVIVCMGCGVGMINAVIQTFMPNWTTIFFLVLGPLYLLSGIYFLIDEIPPPLRDYLLYNPLLHMVGWFRSGFYPNYSVTYIDHGYALCWSIAALILGLGVQRVARRKLLEPR